MYIIQSKKKKIYFLDIKLAEVKTMFISIYVERRNKHFLPLTVTRTYYRKLL